MAPQTNEPKPQRLYFETYVQMIRNAVGSKLFRNFYVRLADGQHIDSMGEGANSCAFFVSSVLSVLKRLKEGVHGTVDATKRDLLQSGWQALPADSKLQPGDVVVWESQAADDGEHEHIGFYIGDDRAVSTSSSERQVVEHDVHFDGARSIAQVFRCSDWT